MDVSRNGDKVEMKQRQQALDEEYLRLVAAAKKKWVLCAVPGPLGA